MNLVFDIDRNMKDSPATSLFKHIQVDSIAVEEFEAEEDDIRLQKELKDELEREFGDFGEGNGSMDGSSYLASVSGNINSNSAKIANDFEGSKPRKSGDSYTCLEQLEVLYNVRLREIEQLRTELENVKQKSELENQNLSENVKIAQQETRKIIESRDDIQRALMDSSSHLRETEKDLAELKKKLNDSELIKRDALHELEMCKMTIREQEQRLKIAETNSYRNEEANFDYILRELTLKHKHDLSSMEKAMNVIKNRLTEKEEECTKLKQQWSDLQRSHQNALIEKTNIIEKLEANLDECYSRHEKLFESSKKEELDRVVLQLKQQVAENGLLRKEISSLSETLEEIKRQEFRDRRSSCNVGQVGAESENGVKLTLLEEPSLDLKSKEKELEEIRSKLTISNEQCQSMKSTILHYQSNIDLLKKQNESLETELLEAKQQEESIKIAAADFVSKTTLEHEELMNQMELECSKKILELESQAAEAQSNLRIQASSIFAEEIERTMADFAGYYDKFRKIVGQLSADREHLIKLLERYLNELEKYRVDCRTLYQKYLNARKVGVKLKKEWGERELLRHQQKKLMLETLNDVQTWLNDDSAPTKSERTEKLYRLIEKTFENIRVDEEVVRHEYPSITCENIFQEKTTDLKT